MVRRRPPDDHGYPIEVFGSEEDDGFIAVVPDLAGCSAWGKTEVEAIHEAHDAIAAWIKAAKEHEAAGSRAVPAGRARPCADQQQGA
ncbi:MAG: type II toxin-antitoxin system HicB family antitoxin [Betaproteobacteria bacterium]|nr:type II toxin-antitoxin system HicB family antitoxin [Betaproteobacteria bacterium]